MSTENPVRERKGRMTDDRCFFSEHGKREKVNGLFYVQLKTNNEQFCRDAIYLVLLMVN